MTSSAATRRRDGHDGDDQLSRVVAEVVRNGFVESHHHGRIVGLAADGSTSLAVGDVSVPILPRSSLKPLQAAGMLRCGLDVDSERLAVICASHSGEDEHVAVVRRLLAGAGLSEDDLDNTPGMPIDSAVRRALTRAGEGPSRLRQNCSGKHAGMLATCVAAGWPTGSYRSPGSELQRSLAATVATLCGEPVAATTVDGCGAPAFGVSLVGLARGVAALAVAAPDTAEGRCAAAMRDHPWLIGGTGRDVTRMICDVPGLIAKDGAEGVYVAALADGRAVAVKIEDGSGRARVPVLLAAFRRLGLDVPEELSDLETVPVLGHGEPVGALTATLPA